MTQLVRDASPVAGGRTATPGGFRPDIEGLRTVAIVAVLLYHAGIPGADAGFAGVDVFFVVSGFLITGVMLREVDRTGRLSIGGFYARRVRRLLPAAALVLVTCAVLSPLLLPSTQQSSAGWDVAAAAAYVVNWLFAARAVDYLAEDAAASPVQHFWSLAVEEQFYVLWPLLLVLAVVVARRARPALTFRAVAAVALGLVAALSFAAALVADGSPSSFFVTSTRLWELAAGALLAVGIAQVRTVPPAVLRGAGWAGAGLLVVAAFVVAEPRAWPGLTTLLPVLGTVLLLAAGSAGGTGLVTRALSTRPMVWLGGLSYSLYLWHWPLLVFARAQWGELGAAGALAVVVLSFVPAWMSLRFLENPVRTAARLVRSTRASLAVGAGLTAVGLVAGATVAVTTSASAPTTNERTTVEGAQALLDRGTVLPPVLPASVVPAPAAAPKDLPEPYADGCQATKEATDVVVCEYGDSDGATTVAVVGDSKVLQWQPALDLLAQEEGWRLVVMTKSSCAWTASTPHIEGVPYTECVEWNGRLEHELSALDPDVVLTSQYQREALGASGRPEESAMVDGLRAVWSAAQLRGAVVGVLLDNPHPEGNVYECVAEHPAALDRCSFERAAGVERSAAPVQRHAAEGVPGVHVLDLADAVCTTTCWPVVGDVLVYRQTTHLTRTYVESAAPQLLSVLRPVVASSQDGPR